MIQWNITTVMHVDFNKIIYPRTYQTLFGRFLSKYVTQINIYRNCDGVKDLVYGMSGMLIPGSEAMVYYPGVLVCRA